MTWILLAHLWGDYFIQTDAQAAEKPHCWRAMGRHLAGYHVAMTAAALAEFGVSWQAAAFLAISAISHAVIDRRWPVIWLAQATGSPRFAATAAGAHILDQVLHVTFLAAAYTALTSLT